MKKSTSWYLSAPLKCGTICGHFERSTVMQKEHIKSAVFRLSAQHEDTGDDLDDLKETEFIEQQAEL